MKKILLLLIIFFLPVLVNAETCDTSNIKIKSVSLVDKVGSAEEVNKPTFSKLEANTDVRFKSVGDSIHYRIVVKNDSYKEFVLDKPDMNSKYITYTYMYNDHSSTVKARSEKTVDLVITYKNEVPDELLDTGYTENKKINLSLSGDSKKTIINPKTNSIIVILLILIFIVIALLVIEFNGRKTKLTLLFIMLLMIPTSIYAFCKANITTNSKVEVAGDKLEFCYSIINEENLAESTKEYFPYDERMTFEDFINSDYNLNSSGTEKYYFNKGDDSAYLYKVPVFFVDSRYFDCTDNDCKTNYQASTTLASLIKDKSDGCYINRTVVAQ